MKERHINQSCLGDLVVSVRSDGAVRVIRERTEPVDLTPDENGFVFTPGRMVKGKDAEPYLSALNL